MTEKERLRKNIKYLRTAFNESQWELSTSIGLESPNSISNYEKGNRYPTPEIRQRIAAHYRITEDELLHSDYSNISFPAILFDKNKLINAIIEMFPIFKIKNAEKDSLFQQGYDAHMRILDAMKKEQECLDVDVDIALDSYWDSYDTNNTLEALANILWFFMVGVACDSDLQVFDTEDTIKEKNTEGVDLLKTLYLKDMSNLTEDTSAVQADKQERTEFRDCIFDILKELKKNSGWEDLSYYYVAFMYVYGCTKNQLTNEMNRAIGIEMIYSFARLGNKYARKFLKLYK